MELISPFGVDARHSSRAFGCCWPERREDGLQVALRLRTLADRLLEIAPVAFHIWPLFDSRRPRPTDPGPVASMNVEDLGRLIERRGRFDPPRAPAPVSPEGYSFVLSAYATVPPRTREEYGVFVRAGASNPRFLNHVVIDPELDNPIWADADAALRLLDVMVEAFDATWAAVYGHIPTDVGADSRPWMTWTTESPPPAADAFKRWQAALDAFGPASEVRPHRGGQLSFWP